MTSSLLSFSFRILKWRNVFKIKIIFLSDWVKIRYKKVYKALTGTRSRKN